MGQVWVVTDERYLAQRMPRALVEELRARGVPTRVLLADRQVLGVGTGRSAGADPWQDLRAGDVVVARSRNRVARSLLQAAAGRAGVRVITPPGPLAAVRDKALAAQLLAGRGVPTPATWLVDSPAALRALPPECFPVLLKPHAGDNATGIVLVRDADELDDVEWGDSMVLAQQFVDGIDVDVKLYVVDDTVWAVRRPSPLVLPGRVCRARIEQVPVTDEMRRIAATCADAFDLRMFGVDLLETAAGPLAVDVNEFPNYTGVDEAPGVLADAVLGARVAVAA
jgi:ribosomal protein S6--L-glutamate ligase